MRALIVLMVVLLAGCTSSAGLGQYMVRLSDLPPDCEFLDPDSSDGEFLVEELNWTGNPGSVDNDVFEEEDVEPVANLVAWYTCDDAEVISVALQFASIEDARTFVQEDAYCEEGDDEYLMAVGPVVAFIDGDGDETYERDVDAAKERIQRSTGMMSACDYLAQF